MVKPILCVDTHELAWAAGFFDGEGSFMWHGRKRKEISMSISQADLQPLERFHRAIGKVGTLRGPYRTYYKGNEGKPVWVVGTHGLVGTQAVIAMLWRWLSEPKRKQAIKTLAAAIPYYRNRHLMGRGRAALSLEQAVALRAEHAQLRVGRKRVPKGSVANLAAKYGLKYDTLASICGGRGYAH